MTDDEKPDPLVAIAYELHLIRQLLEAHLGSAGAGRDEPPEAPFVCRGCGHEAMTGGEAEDHARSEHGAPEGVWEELFTER